MKNRIESNPSQNSTWNSGAFKVMMEMGPIKRNVPKSRSDPPPMTTARVIMVYGTNWFKSTSASAITLLMVI